jgi:predicted outer membrane repeat protein
MAAAGSSATTWHVPGDAPTIQGGLDLASPGHTVLVGPGTYVENILMRDGVTLLSSGGPGVTFVIPAYLLEPIVRCIGLGSGTVIHGFTFQYGEDFLGAGVYCSGSAVMILENRFLFNCAYDGAAIAMVSGTGGSIENNVFEQNLAESWGGAILLEDSSPKVSGNTFRGNYAYFGAAIVCKYGSCPDIVDNEFVENRAGKQGGAIHCRYDCAPLIRQNLFQSNEAAGSGGAIVVHENSTPRVEYNVFWGNSASNACGIGLSFGSNAWLHNNTFYANYSLGDSLPATIGAYSNSIVTVRNCIITSSTGGPAVACYEGSTADLDCNDLWSNDSNYLGCAPGPNDFYLDPMLCDPEYGVFYLDCMSPCSDHYVCGLVGALDVGCGSTRTQPTTWGAIKAMYMEPQY